MSYLFIAHDLSVVRHISKVVVVMYLGHIMEIDSSDDLYSRPVHPYTRALLSAIPVPDPKKSRALHREVLQGDVPSPIDPPAGCPFATRCKFAAERCMEEMPALQEIESGHYVACHCWKDI